MRTLESGEVEGDDPLAAFPPSTARYLARLSSFENVPDIVVNSELYDPATGEVAAFEELIGCHGGAGGMQTQPFVAFPSSWSDAEPSLHGAESVHRFLSRFVAGLPADQGSLSVGGDHHQPATDRPPTLPAGAAPAQQP